MRKSRVRLAGVVAAPLLVLSAACGSPDDASGREAAGEESEQPSGGGLPSGAPEPAGPASGDAALRKVLLGADEIEGYRGATPDQQPLTPEADRAECQPLADLTVYGTGRSPRAGAFAGRTFSGAREDTAGNILAVSLLSYEGKGAEDTLEGVRSALEECGEGFEISGDAQGGTIRYTEVREAEAVGEGGEETVAVRILGEADGREVPMNFVVTRSGSTLAQFMNLSLRDPAGVPVPGEAVTAQLDKLSGAPAS